MGTNLSCPHGGKEHQNQYRIPLSPFMITHILEPTHLSINSATFVNSHILLLIGLGILPSGSSCEAIANILQSIAAQCSKGH